MYKFPVPVTMVPMAMKKAARESRVLSRTGEKSRQREALVIQSLLGHSLGKEREFQWNQ